MESSSLRRQIAELRVLYQLKPHFRDVIVEGRDDAALIGWYLRERGIQHVRVYAVDDRVSVPADLVQEVHVEVNARGRVVALASLAEEWQLPEASITCIVDDDFDLLDQSLPELTALLRTDYAAMEVYSLTERPLSKFLYVVAKSDLEASTVLSLLWPAWASVYALRHVIHNHADGMRLGSRFAERCINDVGEVTADVASLLRSCSPSPKAATLQQLLDLHTATLQRIPNGSLRAVRGHDVAPLLIQYLDLKNDLAKVENVERLLRQSLEAADLDEFRMFQSLLDRLT